MHPNPSFREQDHVRHRKVMNDVGFGMVFAQTAKGPRVAHAPVLAVGEQALRFHLARGNALTRQLHSSRALIVVNGPDGYVSPRWYSDLDQVPTWNYVALEFEGTVQPIDESALVSLLDDLSAREEARLAGTPWTRNKMDPVHFERLLRAIVGFQLEIEDVRETYKLSQNKSEHDRSSVAAALDSGGSTALAALMREPPR